MAKPGFRLALFATLLALIVVLLGAYTRLTHAGLSCPDWPGCYGFISVPTSEAQLAHAEQIGREPCRESVCPYVSLSVGPVSFKKKISKPHPLVAQIPNN